MSSILFHGAKSRTPITKIDPAEAGRGGASAEHGQGFYTRPVWQNPDVGKVHGMDSVRDNAGWASGGGGVVYGIEIPEHFDIYSNKNQQRFLTNTAPIDKELVDKVAKGMRRVDSADGADTKFGAGADKLEADFKNGKLSHLNTKQLVQRLQTEFGVDEGKPGKKTSTDIFHESGIAGMYNGTNDSVVVLDPKGLPNPKPYAARFPGNPDADNVGKVLDTINQSKSIPPNLDGPLRKMALEAALDTEAGKPGAYQKVESVRVLMKDAGVEFTPDMDKKFATAQESAGKVAGLSPEQIDLNSKAQTLVDNRPPRVKGEGFEEYHGRVYQWYDKNNPNPTPEQNTAFNRSFYNTMYRDAQHHYADVTADALAIKNDPAKVERMLQQEPAPGSREFQAIRHIESDAGRYHSTQEFNESKRGGHLPGLKGGVLGIIGAAAAGGAAAAEPKSTKADVIDATVNSALPGYTEAKKGNMCRAFGEAAGAVAGGGAMVAATPPAVTAAVGVTVASGPLAPLVGPVAGMGATAAVAAAGAAVDSAVSSAAEAACEAGTQMYRRAKSAFSLGS